MTMPSSSRHFEADVTTRLQRGEHLVLYGRHRHLGTLSLPMPAVPTGLLHRLFRNRCGEYRLPRIPRYLERQIIRSARGRPGWIVQCARLITEERYWRGEILQALLCVDTEIALRQGHLKLLPQPQRADPFGADPP